MNIYRVILLCLIVSLAGGCYAARRAQYAQQNASTNALSGGVISTGKVDRVTQLLQDLRGRKDIESLAEQFVVIGQPVVPTLIKLLQEGSKDERSRTMYVLDKMKIPPADIIPVLGKMLDDHCSDRMNVALELQKLSPDSERAFNVLSEELKNGDGATRIIIVRMLSLNPSEKYVPVLLDITTDKERGVRMAVMQTLGEMAARNNAIGAAMVPILIKALEDISSSVRCMAARNLGVIGPSAKSAAPALEKLANDKNKKVVQAASDALKRINIIIKPKKIESKKALKDLLK